MNTLTADPYVTAIVSLALLVYVGIAAQRLPTGVLELFDNMFVRFAVFAGVAYMARANPTVALISAVAVLVTLQTLAARRHEAKMNAVVAGLNTREGEVNLFESQDGAVEFDEEAVKHQDFRDSFYPQIVNMDTDVYEARDNQSSISGFDAADQFASI